MKKYFNKKPFAGSALLTVHGSRSENRPWLLEGFAVQLGTFRAVGIK
jgi:hypothetical protein